MPRSLLSRGPQQREDAIEALPLGVFRGSASAFGRGYLGWDQRPCVVVTASGRLRWSGFHAPESTHLVTVHVVMFLQIQ
jgi:hypothetical protein